MFYFSYTQPFQQYYIFKVNTAVMESHGFVMLQGADAVDSFLKR